MPYYGWRRKPLYPPSNLNEYFNKVKEMNSFFSPLYFFIIINQLIKLIEIKIGYKYQNERKVLFKEQIFKKLHIIIFSNYKFIFYKNKFRFSDIKNNEIVLLQTTRFGRILNYKKK